MLIADIKGKLSLKEYHSEDFLTSSVFSALNYLPNEWLKAFLETARNIEGDNFAFTEENSHFEFWPYFKELEGLDQGVEPDLLIFAGSHLCIVEAKLHAGKSGVGFEEAAEGGEIDRSKLRDQLAREYVLGDMLTRNGFRRSGFSSTPVSFSVLYITNDVTFPREDVSESVDAIRELDRFDGGSGGNIYWTSWLELVPVLEKIIQNVSPDSFEQKIASELVQFLDRREISHYGGYSFLNRYHNLLQLHGNVFFETEGRPLWGNPVFHTGLPKIERRIFFEKPVKTFWKFRSDFAVIVAPDSIFFENGGD